MQATEATLLERTTATAMCSRRRSDRIVVTGWRLRVTFTAGAARAAGGPRHDQSHLRRRRKR
ncbi:MAG: hypothetical protein KGI87_15925, partial [Burkholderiales bacterium]|nr:hypothetical protein [Burkholderiales bacterium]